MKARTFILNDTITARRIKKLIEDIETCKSKVINLHLCSDGGCCHMADIFIDFTRKSDKKINLIGNGKMISACVHIFIEAKGSKWIYPYTTAMLHVATIDPYSRDLLNKKSFASVQDIELKKENEERLKRYKHIFDLSDEEYSIIENGGDLGIGYERLKQALPKINKTKLS